METSNEIFIFIGLLTILLAASIQQMLPNPPATAVGIDLGTTFSCVAVFEDGEINVIPNSAGSSITPSVLFVTSDGESVVVGAEARGTAARQPGTLLYDAKRFIGKPYDEATAKHDGRGLPFELAPRHSDTDALDLHLQLHAEGQRMSFAPEEVGALIVRQLKEAAERHVGRDVGKAVLAVPVGFSAAQINATRRAAQLAGLEVLRMIHEPTAAAMAYGLHQQGQSMTVMVYDMGGGTLDVSLLNLNNLIFEVMAASGDNRLGGQDFSATMLDLLIEKLRQKLGSTAFTADGELMRALREEAERLKVEMNDECDCSGNFYDGDVGAELEVELPPGLAHASPIRVSRSEFEAAAAELFARGLAPVRNVLERVRMAASDVDEIVLVGGSSRMARVRSMLRDFFNGQEPNCMVSPEEAVAHGTAIQAAILTDRKKIAIGATEAALFQHIDVER